MHLIFRYRLVRNILADKPRVTKFPVEFDAPPADMVPLAGVGGEAAEDDAATDMFQNGAPMILARTSRALP